MCGIVGKLNLTGEPVAPEAIDGRTFRFASEMKAILSDAVSKELDLHALHLAYRYIPHPHRIFQSIRRLPPARSWRNASLSAGW